MFNIDPLLLTIVTLAVKPPELADVLHTEVSTIFTEHVFVTVGASVVVGAAVVVVGAAVVVVGAAVVVVGAAVVVVTPELPPDIPFGSTE